MKQLLIICILLANSALAADNQIHVKVDGLVCDFCAQSLEKVFSKEEAVQDITVDLDKSYVLITLKNGKSLTDDRLKTLITDSGYNIAEIDHKKPHE